MEERLRANDHKKHWRELGADDVPDEWVPEYLLRRLREEVEELAVVGLERWGIRGERGRRCGQLCHDDRGQVWLPSAYR